MQRTNLTPDYEISRVIRGGWQMASGHGALVSEDPVSDMVAFADAGITTFDCADIYTGVEELIGRFRLHYRDVRGQDALDRIKVHTKFVPDLDVLPRITKSYVEGVIDQSLRRLNLERLDLVQFHWWDYDAPLWLETAQWLGELRQAGKIHNIGATNFDTDHMVDIATAGVPLVSMQVQYSLLDTRPAKRMAAAAGDHGVSFLCYGTVAGGFLSDQWLGLREPDDALENRSLVKYKLIIDDFGGWDLFQTLLKTLRGIADRHGTDIATVASAAMLKRPGVAGVIVGARNRSHLPSNLAISDLQLTAEDHGLINGVLAEANKIEGDVYTLERDRHGRHGSIMKYNLNKGAA
ncbi:aryl-alcohol dehydrogenase-like predicted oxidoreductase [Mesorhizobium soli]|uniref:aldo/keto reductase n=1 Tax=Pseudaminobacter soli (ex Li et al. 2025) TaxID=1295366 RepID=UPI002472FD67|nr:aldo/keto reductase [Mesorhizobium soli]MDH6234137.1 aryl-alcohol dehydrogenase-like predicted oxidoreductase [Mesorhizobium soli]